MKRHKRKDYSGCVRDDGYVVTQINNVSKYEHVRVAERALGKLLPEGTTVHHVDGNPSNNEPTNLVICPDNAYHMLIHQRMRALAACGNANWLRCCRCKTYDLPSNMHGTNVKKQQAYHQSCNTAHQANLRRRKATITTTQE